MIARSSFLLAAALFTVAHCCNGDDKNQGRVLFVGNSITLHAPAPQIGWEGNWGMAASAARNDYVHLVVEGLAKALGARPDFRAVNIAEFERGYADYDLAGRLAEVAAFGADTVVVAIGENVPELASDAEQRKFRERVVDLLKLLGGKGGATVYVRSCFWPDAAKDAALKAACAEAGGVFVDISALGQDEGNFARAERKIEHAGVAGHPGDKGMRAIADALLAAMGKAGR